MRFRLWLENFEETDYAFIDDIIRGWPDLTPLLIHADNLEERGLDSKHSLGVLRSYIQGNCSSVANQRLSNVYTTFQNLLQQFPRFTTEGVIRPLSSESSGWSTHLTLRDTENVRKNVQSGRTAPVEYTGRVSLSINYHGKNYGEISFQSHGENVMSDPRFSTGNIPFNQDQTYKNKLIQDNFHRIPREFKALTLSWFYHCAAAAILLKCQKEQPFSRNVTTIVYDGNNWRVQEGPRTKDILLATNIHHTPDLQNVNSFSDFIVSVPGGDFINRLPARLRNTAGGVRPGFISLNIHHNNHRQLLNRIMQVYGKPNAVRELQQMPPAQILDMIH